MKGYSKLTKTHPHLIEEWDFTKNGNLRPKDVSYGSGKKVWWICNECTYVWKASIKSRTLVKTGCPACAGKVVTDRNRLSKIYPSLLDDWDYYLNGENPTKVSFGSNKKVWWYCKKCNCSWKAVIAKRTIGGRGCPGCCGRVVTEKNCLSGSYPEIAKEFDAKKNTIPVTDLSYGSNKRVWWKCLSCKNRWKTAVHNRTLQNTGCPVCSGRVVSDKNSLSKIHPNLSKDWDKGRNICEPGKVSYGSTKKAHWKCSKCKYQWVAIIASRSNGNGCPSCSRRVITIEYNLKVLYPSLIENEWVFEKNDFSPEECFPGTHVKAWWRCSGCEHNWKAAISGRTSGGAGCPVCAVSRVSSVSQKWLDLLEIEHINREYYLIDLRVHVDGFDPKTNTVYEFLGDYWHGNPEIYSSGGVNQHNKKSFGQLYEETFARLGLIKSVGYGIIYIWEKDFLDKKKSSMF